MRNVDGKHVLAHTDAEWAEIKKKMDDRGFALSAVGSPVGKSKIEDDFQPELDRYKRAVECAQFFGCEFIRAFSFFPPENGDREGYKAEAVERIRRMLEIAQKAGVIYALENESGIYTHTMEACVEFFSLIQSPALRLAFDPGNFIRNGTKPFPEAYEALKAHIGYFHAKDATGSQFVPCGEGEANMAGLLKAAYGAGFDSFLSIEPHLGYLKELTKAQQFTKAANALKTVLNGAVGTTFSMAAI
jgi:sugar phosphate isomerase/epimerase